MSSYTVGLVRIFTPSEPAKPEKCQGSLKIDAENIGQAAESVLGICASMQIQQAVFGNCGMRKGGRYDIAVEYVEDQHGVRWGYANHQWQPMEKGESICEIQSSPDFFRENKCADNVRVDRDTDIIRTADNEIIVLMANGGWIRLHGNAAITAFIKPQG